MSNNVFQVLPCEETFTLKPEDEISLDSILSSLVDAIEPVENELRKFKFEVPAKVLLNEQQAIIFEEHLYISKLKEPSCQLNEEPKIFVESEAEEVGRFKLNIQESYDGYIACGKSEMLKETGKFKCGHWVRGKYNDKLNFLCEKRKEYDFVDDANIEKTLDAQIIDDKLIVKRETKINNDCQHFKTVLNVKDHKNPILLDTGILLLIRYLIVNNRHGDFNYNSVNLAGKFIRCQLTIREEPNEIKIFHRTFTNIIHVRNVQYFDNCEQEISDTFYTAEGKMILHYWHNFNYFIHETKGFVPKRETIMPKLELMWRSHNQLLNQYRFEKKLIYENALEYFENHPELRDFLHDYLLNVLKYKPCNVLEFGGRFFQKFKMLPKQHLNV